MKCLPIALLVILVALLVGASATEGRKGHRDLGAGFAGLADSKLRFAASSSRLASSHSDVAVANRDYHRIAGGDLGLPATKPRSTRSKVALTSSTLPLEQLDVSHQRAPNAIVFLNSSATNETLEADLCPQLGSDTVVVDIDATGAPPDVLFDLPTCLRDSSASEVRAANVRLTSWALLPANITILRCSDCTFESGNSEDRSSTTGLNGTTVVWSAVWTICPYFNSMTILRSYLTPLPTALPPSFSLSILQNKLNLGAIPSDMFINFASTPLDGLNVQVLQSPLSGSLPADLFAPLATAVFGDSDQVVFNFDVRDSALQGSIPPGLFLPLKNAVLKQFRLTLANNNLNGTIPSDLFPSGLIRSNSGSDVTFNLDLSYNGFSGSLPDNLLYNISAEGILLKCTSCSLTGTLPALGQSWLSSSTSSLAIRLDDNGFHGGISETLLGRSPPATADIDVSSNSNLNGTISNALLTTTNFLSLDASNNELHGPVPLGLANVSRFDLRGTKIDFCTAPLDANPLWTTESCSLDSTTAACDCPSSYAGCGLSATVCPPPPSPLPPTTPPVVPSATPSSPPTTPPSTRVCNPSTRPSTDFVCVDGVWTAPNAPSPILNIPSGAGPIVVVSGNVSSTSLIFNSVGTTLSIGGCATNLSTVTIQLTAEEVKRLGSSGTLQTLIQLSNTSSCNSTLSQVDIEAKATSGCRKVKAEKQVSSDGKTLSSFFTVDRSACNRWWIILVSVVCGVILLAVIGIVLLAVLSPSFRKRIRPFSQRRAGRSSVS